MSFYKMKSALNSLSWRRRGMGRPNTRFQTFAGRKTFLVLHLRTGAYPVPHVDIRESEFLGLLDLPQNTVGAITGLLVRLVKGVNRRQAIVQNVNNADHFEFAMLAVGTWRSKFNQSGIDPALKQELFVLLHTVMVHAAPSMTAVLIA